MSMKCSWEAARSVRVEEVHLCTNSGSVMPAMIAQRLHVSGLARNHTPLTGSP
jgi:hypothetical protein